jgi:hypothetical protein
MDRTTRWAFAKTTTPSVTIKSDIPGNSGCYINNNSDSNQHKKTKGTVRRLR